MVRVHVLGNCFGSKAVHDVQMLVQIKEGIPPRFYDIVEIAHDEVRVVFKDNIPQLPQRTVTEKDVRVARVARAWFRTHFGEDVMDFDGEAWGFEELAIEFYVALRVLLASKGINIDTDDVKAAVAAANASPRRIELQTTNVVEFSRVVVRSRSRSPRTRGSTGSNMGSGMGGGLGGIDMGGIDHDSEDPWAWVTPAADDGDLSSGMDGMDGIDRDGIAGASAPAAAEDDYTPWIRGMSNGELYDEMRRQIGYVTAERKRWFLNTVLTEILSRNLAGGPDAV